MFHTIYKIKNKINNKFYVGMHSTKKLDDGYMGSGIVVSRAIDKYGVENFDKQILFNFDNPEDMVAMEELIVDKSLINQPDCYNLDIGGKGHYISTERQLQKLSKSQMGHPVSEEVRAKLRKANLGKKHSEETKRKISLAGVGRKHSEETKRKIGLGQLGQSRPKGKDSPSYGRTVSEETKRKIGLFFKGRKHSKKKSEKAKKKISLSRLMMFSFKKDDIDRVKKLQEEYFELCGYYNSKYEGLL